MQIIAAGLALGLVAACSTNLGQEINTARGLTPTGSAFNKALYSGYLGEAETAMAESDWWTADHFAAKAKAAAGGAYVPPDNVSDWDVPEDQVAEMNSARERLMTDIEKLNRLDPNERTALHGRLANAQVLFDCWLEEAAEKIRQPDPAHHLKCRDPFYAELEYVEPFLEEPEPEPEPEPMAEPMPEPVEVPRSYLVFFDWDSSALTAEGRDIVRTAANNADKAGVTRIEVTGHADRSGPDQYNMGLSMRRADAVKAALMRNGIPEGEIAIYAKGEREPLVPTPDGVREPQNRRVEIVLK